MKHGSVSDAITQSHILNDLTQCLRASRNSDEGSVINIDFEILSFFEVEQIVARKNCEDRDVLLAWIPAEFEAAHFIACDAWRASAQFAIDEVKFDINICGKFKRRVFF